MQVCEHKLAVVGSGEQVEGLGGESRRPHLRRVQGVEGLEDPATPHVVQHAAGVLVAGDEQAAGRIDGHGGRGAAWKKERK